MRVVPILSCAGLALPLLAGELFAQQTLADRAPADTLLYLSADTHRLVEGALGLDLVRLLDEAQVRDFVQPLAGQAHVEASSAGLRKLIDAVPWRDYVNGRVELALRGIEIRAGDASIAIAPSRPIDARALNQLGGLVDAVSSGRAASIEIAPDVVVAIDVGSKFASWQQEMIGSLSQQGVPVVVSDERIAGRAATRLAFAVDREAPTATVYLVPDQGRWWIGSASSLERALAGGGGPKLAQDAAFRRCVDQVASEPPALLAYFNVAHAGRIFERFLPPIVKEELDLLGVSAIESIGVASSFVAGGVRDSFGISWSEPPKGLLSLLDCVDGGFDYLRFAPAETGFYFGLRAAPEALIDKLVQVSEQIAPGSSRGLEMAFAAMEQETGLDVRETLLPALGDEIGVWLTPPGAGAMLPDGMVMCEVGDREQFARLVAHLRQLAGSEGPAITEARGLPAGCEGFTLALPDAPIQPAFALTDHAFCVAPNVLALKSSLKAMQAGRTTNAMANPRLQQVLTGLTGRPTADGLSLLAFLDLQQLVALGYQFVPMAAGAMQEQAGLDPALLPDAETVAGHFSGIGLAGRSDAHGLMVSLFTPTGILPLAAGSGLAVSVASRRQEVMAAQAVPSPAAPTEIERPVKSANARPLAQLFANLERATGATIDYPVALADFEVQYTARSGELEVVLAELADLVGFRYTIAQVDGEPLVTITQG